MTRGRTVGIGGLHAIVCTLIMLAHTRSTWAGCFKSQVSPRQGLCTDTYEVKVCAATQADADAYVSSSHGVIVKANCKKALTILCGDLGAGSPTEDLEAVCCSVANQCETDEHCGTVVDPAKVPMCCEYCEDLYNEACESGKPVNSGFSSIIQLYEAFHAAAVTEKCTRAGDEGSIPCKHGRTPGAPCLQYPVGESEGSTPEHRRIQNKNRRRSARGRKHRHETDFDHRRSSSSPTSVRAHVLTVTLLSCLTALIYTL